MHRCASLLAVVRVATKSAAAILIAVQAPTDLDVEATGTALLAIVAAFRSLPALGRDCLVKHRLATVDAEGRLSVDTEAWYPVQSYLAAFAQIVQENGPAALYGVGLGIMENVHWPPGITTISDAVQSIDFAYHLNHKKHGALMANVDRGTILEGIGHYKSRRVLGKRRIILVVDSLYPCDFDRGVVTGVAIRFDARAEVIHDPTAPCRQQGGPSCTYIVSW